MKTRAQERAESVEPEASQSSQQQHPRSNNRKRRASSVSHAESGAVDDSSQLDSQPAIKKRKKTKVVVKEVAHNQGEADHPELSPIREDSSQPAADAFQTSQVNNSQLSQITTKTTTSRRATLPAFSQEDALSQSQSQSQKKSKPRKSMPASLAVQHLSPARFEFGMMSLNKLVQERMKQRLESQTMIQLDGSDDNEMSQHETDILVYGNVDGPSQPPEIEVQSPSSERADSLTDFDSIPIKSDQERANYEASIKRLAREAAEAKSSLEILIVELSSMGFGSPDANAQAVIDSIRASFDHVRHRLQDILPFDVAADVQEQTFLMRIADQLVAYAHSNNKKDTIITEQKSFEQELLTQIDVLIDKLAEANLIRNRLEQANGEFDNQNEEDDRYIKELETKLLEVEKNFKQVSKLLTEKVSQAQTLETENSVLDDSCEKLKTALDGYRQTEANLHDLISRMEQDHAAALNELTDHHKAEQHRFTEEVRIEKEARVAAESRATGVEKAAADLSKSLEKEAAMISKLKAEIEGLRADIVDVQAGKESAEDDAATKASTIIDLQKQLEKAETDLARLEDDYADLQKLHEAEKRQREAAEAELDETHVKVKSLNDKLHKQGVEANELRQKLFEVQQRDHKTIKEYQTTMAERTEQYEADLSAETARREDAENVAAERQSYIEDLESKLANLEADMRKTFNEKEALLQQMEDRCVKLEEEVEELQTALGIKTAEHNALQQSTSSQIKTLETTIGDLTSTLNKTNTDLNTVRHQASTQQEQMLATLADRDASIDALKHDVEVADSAISVLQGEKASLESRVEHEAITMLTYTAEKEAQVASLKDIIGTKQAEIEDLQERAREVDTAWNATVTEKNSYIETLETSAETREESYEALREKNRELREKFEEYVAKATHKIGTLSAEVDRLAKLAKDGEGELKREGKRLLEDVMEVEEEEAAVNGIDHSSVSPAVRVVEKKRVKKGRRTVRDSGIGGSSDMEGMFS
ncbi:hypothetical protein KVT40_000659 [Elsinoe batatas]|uniref:Uncharacterized protein n=1 Tax=Elsinoe batatas TaxID=2601811 RepID=A0A8K0L853_9PEZI|nr:hypothetical protein KVT40_000659 [Elsinoe batatas]